jgi:HNH endonuclease
MTPPNGNEVEMVQPAITEPDRRCIYCLRDDSPFTAEHVIPEAFGLYGPETMVLNDAVCDRCNQEFGRTLDLVLARDSYEGLLRADILPRVNQRRDRFRPRRTVMRFPDTPQFGEFRGLRVEVDWSIRRPRLLGEIVVRDNAGNRHTYTMDEIRGADPALFRDRPPNSVQIFAPTLEVATALQREAEAHGARFREPTDMDVPENLRDSVMLEITGTIDMGVWRAVGKIAFNYLARVQGAAFVRGPSFDEIRRFVRGELPTAPIRVSQDPILTGETRRWRRHAMHLILVCPESE